MWASKQASIFAAAGDLGNLCDVYTENLHTNHLVKELENRSTFAKVIVKHQVAYFFLGHGVQYRPTYGVVLILFTYLLTYLLT